MVIAATKSVGAGILLIGNELLTGKIQDANLQFLAGELFQLGICLEGAVVCRDDVEVIAREIRALRSRCEVVLTTGGVGPTHDDVTPEGLAAAVGRPLVHSEEILEIVRERFGPDLKDGHRRLALMPEGSELVASESVTWPTVCCENVFMFPGVPSIVRAKWPPVRERLATLSSRSMFNCGALLSLDEFTIAAPLRTVAESFPDVIIGSYLSSNRSRYHTKLTFDGENQERTRAARQAVIAAIGTDAVLELLD